MEAQKEPSYWAAGWSAFAGIMLIMLGLFHAIAGLSEVIDPRRVRRQRGLRLQAQQRRVGLDPPARRHHRLLRRVRDLPRRRLGTDGRRDHRAGQRVRGVLVAALRAGVGDRDHRDRHRRDLGADGARSRRHRLNHGSNGSECRRPAPAGLLRSRSRLAWSLDGHRRLAPDPPGRATGVPPPRQAHRRHLQPGLRVLLLPLEGDAVSGRARPTTCSRPTCASSSRRTLVRPR